MGFIVFSPLERPTSDVISSAAPKIQIWQELTMLRHISGPDALYGKLVTAPWIDQSKVYFQDACKASWKTAGLLYYYSFLNLAKALVVTRRSISASTLKSTSVFHGLAAKAQSPKNILDFEVDIFPPVDKGKRNIFATLYETTTNKIWPFKGPITATISEFAKYCYDISHELDHFYSIEPKVIAVQSLLRDLNGQIWIEVAIPEKYANTLFGYMPSGSCEVINFAQLSESDKSDWFLAHNRFANSLVDSRIIRFTTEMNSPDREQKIKQVKQKSIELLKNLAIPKPVACSEGNWDLVLKASSNRIDFHWDPLLSDYLFAFVLSTVLRYHPHLFDSNQKDAFLAQAWCNQSAISALRYFLMRFTKQSLRLN